MGCCVSTEPAADDHKDPPSGESLDGDTVVKEVLSETPRPQNAITTATDHLFPDDKPSPPPRSDDLHRQISQVLSEIRSIAGKSAGDDDDFYRASPSPSKLRQPERAVGQSPGRRISDQSPGRRNGSARAIQREPGPGMRSANRSGRRSRSPALRGEAGSNNAGRALPERRVNRSPRRVRAGSPESCGKESLENPLVSMECFIFL